MPDDGISINWLFIVPELIVSTTQRMAIIHLNLELTRALMTLEIGITKTKSTTHSDSIDGSNPVIFTTLTLAKFPLDGTGGSLPCTTLLPRKMMSTSTS